jgi:DNA-directed RNA polymerase subunit RPC12/RpoP
MAKPLKCPKCNKILERIRVYSECWQWGYLDGKTITYVDSVEDMLETTSWECPYCGYDFFAKAELED